MSEKKIPITASIKVQNDSAFAWWWCIFNRTSQHPHHGGKQHQRRGRRLLLFGGLLLSLVPSASLEPAQNTATGEERAKGVENSESFRIQPPVRPSVLMASIHGATHVIQIKYGHINFTGIRHGSFHEPLTHTTVCGCPVFQQSPLYVCIQL